MGCVYYRGVKVVFLDCVFLMYTFTLGCMLIRIFLCVLVIVSPNGSFFGRILT